VITVGSNSGKYCNTKTTGAGKGSANTRNGQQVSACRVQRTCGTVVIQKGVKVSRLSGTEWVSVASLNFMR